MFRRGLRGLGLACVTLLDATVIAATARAAAPPAPGIQFSDGITKCTAGFAAQGGDGAYYLFTSEHCNHGAPFTYDENIPLGTVTSNEEEGDLRDDAIIRLDPSASTPAGDVAGQRVRGMLSASQIKPGMPFCKLGGFTGETCGMSRPRPTSRCRAPRRALQCARNPLHRRRIGLVRSGPEMPRPT